MKRIHETRKRLIYLFAVFYLLAASGWSTLEAQSKVTNQKYTGIVVDGKDEPITGAAVQVVGSSIGAVSDMDGKFTVTCPPNATVKISYLGFVPAMVKLSSSDMRKIVLKEDTKVLDEVVVTALGITREAKSLGYARQGIDLESMNEARDANLLNMLSGKASGVQIINSGGTLGSTRVVIRGNSSLTANNQPLFVVDGVPIANEMGDASEGYGDLDYGNIASIINPDDIESIEILKGANAAALYGSGAANGAVLITTKKATRKAGMGVTFNSTTQLTALYRKPDYQSIYGSGQNGRFGVVQGYNYYGNAAFGQTYRPDVTYGMLNLNMANYDRSWGFPMLGFDVIGRNGEVKAYSPQADVFDRMYRTGVSFTNSVSLDKQLNDASFRFSYTNLQADDVLKNFNEVDRHILNLRATAKLTSRVNLDATVRYTREDVKNRGFRNDSNRNPLWVILNLNRDVSLEELIPWKRPNGTAFSYTGFYNPYWLLNELSNEDSKDWFMGNVTANIDLTKQLSLRLRAAVDVQKSKGYSFTNYASPFDIDGQFDTFMQSNVNNNEDFFLAYKQRFWDDKLDVMANIGGSMQNTTRDYLYSRVDVLLAPDNASLSNNASTLYGTQTYSGKIKQGLFGFLSLGYNGWGFGELSLRNDWSSTLPKEHNSYFYYSVGGSLILSELLHLKNDWLSFLKVRASYAQVGNDTGFDLLRNGYVYGGLYLNDMPYYQSENLRKNSLLKPEITGSTETGADIRLFKSRLNLDITHYDRTTRNQIIRADISAVSGYTQKMYNSGEINNKGLEISLKVIPVRKKSFEWTSTLNWSKNNSKVVSLIEGVNRFILGTGGSGNVYVYAEVDKPYGVIYGNAYRRDAEGRILVGRDGNALFDTDNYLGCVQPDFIGGWNNSFRIGAFDVSVLLDFKKGGSLWSYSAYQGARNGLTKQSLEGRQEFEFSQIVLGETDTERQGLLDAGNTNQPTGSNVYYPDGLRPKGVHLPNSVYDESVAGWGGQDNISWTKPSNIWMNYSSSDMQRYVYDASFIKLREISIGYNFPKRWLQKSFLKSVKIGFTGRNIAILYQKTPKGIDPEATSTSGNGQGFEKGFNLPSATYGFNLKVTF